MVWNKMSTLSLVVLAGVVTTAGASFIPSHGVGVSRLAPHAAMMVAGTYSSDDWYGESWREKEKAEEDEQQGPSSSSRWLKLADCDVLPPPSGSLCAGIVHFVGGALVGTAPRQTYSAFLEEVSDAASVCIVCTPCTGLTGLDHYQAATEVMLRWCAALPDVQAMLAARDGGLDATRLPVLGLGHSLGAKLLVLLGSDAKMAEALGPNPRCANALIAYNSYSAKRSVPLLEQAAGLGDAAKASGLASAAAPAVSSLTGLGESLGVGASAGLSALASGLMGGGSGREGSGAEATKAAFAEGLEGAARSLGALGREVGSVGRRVEDEFVRDVEVEDAAPLDEFTPSPEETAGLVSARYAVGRNLLVRFSDDSIDESSSLARLLQARFTDANTGIGGRLDFKKLDGTHVTPNAPNVKSYLGALDPALLASLAPGLAGPAASEAVKALQRASEQRAIASAAVAEFAQREFDRARAE